MSYLFFILIFALCMLMPMKPFNEAFNYANDKAFNNPLLFPHKTDVRFIFTCPPIVCKRADVLFTLFVLVYIQWCSTHSVLGFFLCLVYSML